MGLTSLANSISASSWRRDFQVLASFGLDVGLRGFDAAFELHDFAFQEMDALDGLANFFDQALFLERIEVEIAHAIGHLDASASQGITRAQVRTLLGLRHLAELCGLLQRQKIKLGDLVNLLERVLGLCFDLFFGEFFVVELNDFLDGTRAVAQIFADLQKFLQDQRSARDRFQHEQLPALDALGDGYFAFASEQRHGAHFAQSTCARDRWFFRASRESDQVLRLPTATVSNSFSRFGGIGSIRGGKRSLRTGQVFVHINAVTLEGRE